MTSIAANLHATNSSAVREPSVDAHAPGTAARGSAREPSKAARRTGYALSGLGVLFLTFDAAVKLLMAAPAVESTQQLGWPVSAVFGLGVLQLICLAFYLLPRTAVLGAILWTGYLGGAVATHVRLGNPLFSHQLFPVYIALLLWGGLWLRDLGLRALLPVRSAR
jgi:hypothetical protein